MSYFARIKGSAVAAFTVAKEKTLALLGAGAVGAVALNGVDAHATTASDVAAVFTSVDLSTMSNTLSGIAVIGVGILLVFAAFKLGKRILNRV